MKLSAQEEYGLRCLLQLAKAERNGESLTLSQIASQEGISSANAGKLMWILTKAGLVQSTRGIKGGYVLAIPATDIRLNQVIRVLEGPLAAVPCVSHTAYMKCAECLDEPTCGVRIAMKEVRDATARILDHTTLADVNARVARKRRKSS